jgi:protein-S-isoprenylcysteine O-methyltransferase Ste14
MLGQGMGLIRLFAARHEHSALFFGAAVAARAAVILFLSLVVFVVIVRLRPLAKAEGLGPRLVALLGTCMPSFMVALLPRNPESLPVNTAAFVLVALGSALAVHAFSHLNRAASIMPEARRLVTSGPYRVLRHPVYVFEEIAIVGLLLPYASPWAALMLAAHIACQVLRLRNEERVLRRAFPEYEGYAARTARLVPGLY